MALILKFVKQLENMNLILNIQWEKPRMNCNKKQLKLKDERK